MNSPFNYRLRRSIRPVRSRFKRHFLAPRRYSTLIGRFQPEHIIAVTAQPLTDVRNVPSIVHVYMSVFRLQIVHLQRVLFVTGTSYPFHLKGGHGGFYQSRWGRLGRGIIRCPVGHRFRVSTFAYFVHNGQTETVRRCRLQFLQVELVTAATSVDFFKVGGWTFAGVIFQNVEKNTRAVVVYWTPSMRIFCFT